MTTVALNHASKVTLIQGARGTGKTTLARMIANRIKAHDFNHDKYAIQHMEGKNFRESPFTPFPIDTKVVVVDSLPLMPETIGELEELAKEGAYKYTQKYKDVVLIGPLNFIFTTDTVLSPEQFGALGFPDLTRHVQVITLY